MKLDFRIDWEGASDSRLKIAVDAEIRTVKCPQFFRQKIKS